MDVVHEIVFKTYLQYKNNVQVIFNAKMTYKHLKYVHDMYIYIFIKYFVLKTEFKASLSWSDFRLSQRNKFCLS